MLDIDLLGPLSPLDVVTGAEGAIELVPGKKADQGFLRCYKSLLTTFLKRVSLCSPGCPGIRYTNQRGFKFIDFCSQMLKMYITTLATHIFDFCLLAKISPTLAFVGWGKSMFFR